MGDLKVPLGDLKEALGGAAEEREAPSPPSTSNPRQSYIEPWRWVRAEEASRQIIQKVQPTSVSAERRRAVFDYVQRLFRGTLGLEVFSYGSVPLKTYLPDGDIDLTAFGNLMVEDALVNDMVSVLEGEDQNDDAEFTVKDVQLIRAEVKLVKCIVQNIVVDISINQIGGLCTLCFLEKVDQLIGKDHLFKRSIILIKAWCYYESRILGAHHGLISTYALETLVLYIFNLFHSVLDGPLAVLYKFLDYFGKFDWENYCICLSGPVRISSLPELVVEVPENDGGELLLDSEFLRYCANMFSVSSRGYDMNSRTFQQKHLNIVDPLKENNNLGRSVSKGNYYRIRSAFTYGARKLGRILLLSDDDSIVDDVHNFFSNTLGRHGNGQRPDVQDPNPISEIDLSQFDEISSRGQSGNHTDTSTKNYNLDPSYGSSDKEARDEEGTPRDAACPYKHTSETVKQNLLVHRLCGDATELATSKTQDLELCNGSSKHPILTCNGEVNIGNLEKQFDGHENNHESDLQPKSNDEKGLQHANSLLDLSGDYEHQLSCLQYGRWCYECTSIVPTMLIPPPPPPPINPFQIKSWNPQPLPNFQRNGFSNGGVPNPNGGVSNRPGFSNGGVPTQAFYTLSPPLPPNIAFGEMHKARGTGTYFPNMSRCLQGHRLPPLPSVRSPAPAMRSAHLANGWNATFDRDWHELPPPQSQSAGVDCFEVHNQSFSPGGNGYCPNSTNGTDPVIEFGTVGHVPPLSPSSERSKQRKHFSLPSQQQSSNPNLSRDTDRASPSPVKSAYHLKDDDDFPPLSV
ncbi:unnamed protein product [Cuscuta campestris]|uniref:PAP/OAS1 substrate-binding-related domain-containing protein n=1 Tax=Cuscuta campestris TaxID=132261 RepID=A0A484MSD2_9ASTE|nr:unnamed protein product [Cuscuta campestris]